MQSLTISRLTGVVVALALSLVWGASIRAESPPDAASLEERGEQIMEQMMGANHNAMNQWLEETFGKDGERAMHEQMARMWDAGDREGLSRMGMGLGGMMAGRGMMGGAGWNGMMGGGMMGGMMGGAYPGTSGASLGWGMMGAGAPWMGSWWGFGGLTMILVWVFLILGILAFVRFLKK